MSVLTCVIESMGSSCSRSHSFDETEAAENAKVTCRLEQANAVSRFHFFVGKKQHSIPSDTSRVGAVCRYRPEDFARNKGRATHPQALTSW